MITELTKKEKLLQLLYHNEGYISGEKLSQRFGVSRTTVWKYIKYFREAGYNIESSSKLGYQLVSSPDKLLPEEIRLGLKTKKVAKKIIYFEQVKSTNTLATQKAKEGTQEGTIVVAEEQKKGRGRMNRDFICPAGGLWFSVILRPKIKAMLAARITYLFAVAVAETINNLGSIKAEIKWPNDILVDNKKVCGILTEMSAEIDLINYLVVGVGINLNFSADIFTGELEDKATSLLTELGYEINRVNFFQKLLKNIEELYFKLDDFETVLKRWKELNCTLGKVVTIKDNQREITGKAVDINQNGALILEVDGEEKKIYSGDLLLD